METPRRYVSGFRRVWNYLGVHRCRSGLRGHHIGVIYNMSVGLTGVFTQRIENHVEHGKSNASWRLYRSVWRLHAGPKQLDMVYGCITLVYWYIRRFFGNSAYSNLGLYIGVGG